MCNHIETKGDLSPDLNCYVCAGAACRNEDGIFDPGAFELDNSRMFAMIDASLFDGGLKVGILVAGSVVEVQLHVVVAAAWYAV